MGTDSNGRCPHGHHRGTANRARSNTCSCSYVVLLVCSGCDSFTGPVVRPRGTLGRQRRHDRVLRNLLYDTVLSEAVGVELVAIVEQMINQVDLQTVGLVGVLGLMLIASRIYFQVELAFNDIFATRLQRSWLWRFSLFNVSVLIGPLLVAGGIIISSGIFGESNVVSWVLPWIMTSLAFTAAIKYLPNTPVHWRSAIIGGVLSATAFEAAKSGFSLYTDLLGTTDSMTRLYGSVAFLPLFLISK